MAAFDLAPSCRPNQRFLKFLDYIFVRCFLALINLNMAPADPSAPLGARTRVLSAAGAYVHLPGKDAGMSTLPWME
jgi:hypothetical protein